MDCPHGEFWIDDSGFATFADSDIGDESHESIALQSLISIEDLQNELIEVRYELQNKVDSYSGDLTDEQIDEIGLLDEYTDLIDAIDYDLYQFESYPEEILEEVIGKKLLMDIRYDPRWAYIIHQNAIRVVGLNFEVRKINIDTIERIKDFLDEQYDGTDLDPKCYVSIEEVLPKRWTPGDPYIPRKNANMTFEELMELVNTVADLKNNGFLTTI